MANAHFSTITSSSDEGDDLEPESVLSTSLGLLYDYQPITLADAGSTFHYTYNDAQYHGAHAKPTISLTLRTPDTHAQNWSLHASSVWAASVFLADHLALLDLPSHLEHASAQSQHERRLEILELGAGAGLPGLAIAKWLVSESRAQTQARNEAGSCDAVDNGDGRTGNRDEIATETEKDEWNWRVTLSDYPDDALIANLHANVRMNFTADMKSKSRLGGKVASKSTPGGVLSQRQCSTKGQLGSKKDMELSDRSANADTAATLPAATESERAVSDTHASGAADHYSTPQFSSQGSLCGNEEGEGHAGVEDAYVRVVPYAWGSPASALLFSPSGPASNPGHGSTATIPATVTTCASFHPGERSTNASGLGFDIILAADTLWNSSLHSLFLSSLTLLLRRTADARVHLVAGLHTGRSTVRSFLNLVRSRPSEGGPALGIVDVEEWEVNGKERRPWGDELVRGEEDDRERRRWVIWIILRWTGLNNQSP